MTLLCRGILTAMAMTAATTGSALANDDLVRGLMGLGAAIIINESQRDRARPQYRPRNREPSAAYRARQQERAEQREARAEIQRRLNVLGFDAGYPDGVFGPRTRRAIARFQESVGQQPDGKISEDEIALLYQRSDGISGMSRSAEAAPMPPILGNQGGGQAASAGSFPAIDGAANTQQATGGGFPTLGSAGAAQASASGGFPTFATPSGVAPQAPARAFPTLGAAPSGASPAGTEMPVLGNSPVQPQAAFPTLASGAAATSEEQPMPGLGAAPQQADEAMPVIGGGAAASADPATIVATTFAEQRARTIYAEPTEQPAVLSISLGQPSEGLADRLDKEGFSICDETAAGRIACQRGTDSLNDEIAVWSDAEAGAWAITRTIVFTQPAPADLVLGQFRERYPDITDKPGRVVASGELCHAAQLSVGDIGALIDRIAGVDTELAEFDADIVDYAVRCPLIYKVELNGTDEIDSAAIAFVDTTHVTRLLAARQAARMEAERKKRETLSGDLKL
jgi:peptidoglycan hydrolase-like protein with peptidoglycan-binding domain